MPYSIENTFVRLAVESKETSDINKHTGTEMLWTDPLERAICLDAAGSKQGKSCSEIFEQ